MGKESNQSPTTEHLRSYSNRLEQGIRRAEAVQKTALGLLHEEADVFDGSMPFRITDAYDVTHTDEDVRFDAQLNLSVLAETVTTRTLPVLRERHQVISGLAEYAETDEQIQTHAARVSKMQEQYDKGLFPEKSLDIAKKRAEELAQKRSSLEVANTARLIEDQKNRIQRIREGMTRNLFTKDALVTAENRLHSFESHYEKLTTPKKAIFDTTQTEQLEVEPVQLPEPAIPMEVETFTPMADPEEEALDYYAHFSDVMSKSSKARKLYNFITQVIRENNSVIYAIDLSIELEGTPDRVENATNYLLKESEETMYYRDYEVIPYEAEDSTEEAYLVRKIDHNAPLTEPSTGKSELNSESVVQADAEKAEKITPQNFHLQEIPESRWNALVYLSQDENWTLDGARALLGPMKNGRDLTWINAKIAIQKPINILYGRIRHGVATDEETAVWEGLTKHIEAEGKAALIELQKGLKEEFRTRSVGNKYESEVPTETTETTETIVFEESNHQTLVLPADTSDTLPTIEIMPNLEAFKIHESDTPRLGAMLTDLNGIHIVHKGVTAVLQIDEDLIEEYDSLRRGLRKKLFTDDTGHEIRQEQARVTAKLRRIFTEENKPWMHEILNQQSDEAYILLASIEELHEQFDGLFFDCIEKLAPTAWTHTKNKTRTWHAPYHIPYLDQGAQVTDEKVVTETDDKQLKIERSIPQLRGEITSIIEQAQFLPAHVNFAQLRAINKQLAKMAGYALERGYLKNPRKSDVLMEFDRKSLVLLEYLTRNEGSENTKVVRQPKLVKELTAIIDDEYSSYLSSRKDQ